MVEMHLALHHAAEEGAKLVGSSSLQPRIAAKNARCPVPAARVGALHGELLRQGIAQLRLVDGNEVYVGVVVVHEQVVLQELVAGVRMEVEAVALILDGQTGVQHVTLVLALVVLVRVARQVAALGVKYAIGICLLAHILIVGHPVERQSFCRLVHQSQTTSGLVHVVGAIACQLVFPETVGAVVEGGHREGQLVVYLIVMGHLCVAVEVCAYTQSDVGALIAHGVLGVLAHQSALGVDTVEGTLRTTQHVDTVQLVGVAVEGRLIHQGYVVHIDTH